MRRKKSTLVTILTLIFVVIFMLTACGGPANDVNKGSDTAKSSSQNTTQTVAVKKAPLQLSAMLIQYAAPPDPNGALWKNMMEKFNVDYKIEWIPDADYANKQKLVLSAGDIPDIMYTVTVSDPTVNKAILGGVFADLTPVLGDFSKWPNLAKVNPDAWKTSKVNGKIYLFPRSRDNYDMPIAHLRGDWLKALKMDLPKTFDQFADYLRGVVAADFDGNGKKDTIGITGMSMEIWANAFGPGDKIVARPQGKSTGIVNVKLTESYALLLEYLRKLYAEGLISTEFAMLNGQQQEDLFMAGKSAMYVKNIWHKKRMDNELQKKDPNAFSELMFSLKGPNGTAFNYDKGWAGGLLVSSKVTGEKLTRIVEFMNQSSDPANFNYISFGVEGTHFAMKDGFPQLTDQGKKEITLAITYPFTMATTKFAKVDSPLADAAYNLATRKMTQSALDPVYASYKNPLSLDVLQSVSWSSIWSQKQDEFKAFTTEVITGAKTVDQFREYQKKLLADPLVIKSFDEFQKCYDDLGLAKQ